MAGACGFWQPRRGTRTLPTISDRCRPKGMRTSAVLRPPGISVNFQVETFKLFGKLKKTKTEVHNSLPTIETIQTEKTLMSFEEKRRESPDDADYSDFYRSLTTSITPALSRGPSSITFSRRSAGTTRTNDTRLGLDTRGSSMLSGLPPRSVGTDNRMSLESRSATRSSNATGPLGHDVKATGFRRDESPSARSLFHIHDVAVEQKRQNKQQFLDSSFLERRRKSRHQEVDSLLLDFINRESEK